VVPSLISLVALLTAHAHLVLHAVEVSVVVPTYNSGPGLMQLLDALVSQELGATWEVVVADNGSTDGSRQLAERFRDELPALTVITATERQGSGYARNVGARAARGDLLLFVDHDDVPGEGYLQAMVRALSEHRLVCARLEDTRLNPEWSTRLRPISQESEPIDAFGFLAWGSGGTLGVRRDLFEDLGGFTELPYVEDIDFCWRAQLRGAQLAFVPDAVLHYRHRSTAWAMFKQARSWGAAEYRLQRRYRAYGAPDAHSPWEWETWRPLVRHIPRLRHRAGRAWLATRFGNTLGRATTALRIATGRERVEPEDGAPGATPRSPTSP
jgi:GT2 family glycosyltransferase